MKYLRNRPFMKIQTSWNPTKGSRTHIKDWDKLPKNENDTKNRWELKERYSVVERIDKKDLTECSTIIDILEMKIVTTRYQIEKENVLDFYCSKYTKYMCDILVEWNKLHPGDYATVLEEIMKRASRYEQNKTNSV
jgi:hypothetical protein